MPQDVAQGFGDGHFAGGGRARWSRPSAGGGVGATAGHGGRESGEKAGEVEGRNFG